jgi:hypothetical protein
MTTLSPILTHLALIIDLKEERLEKTHAPFLRRQLSAELEELFKRFQTEYQEFLISTSQEQPLETLATAA